MVHSVVDNKPAWRLTRRSAMMHPVRVEGRADQPRMDGLVGIVFRSR
jgi:hypothetical protein